MHLRGVKAIGNTSPRDRQAQVHKIELQKMLRCRISLFTSHENFARGKKEGGNADPEGKDGVSVSLSLQVVELTRSASGTAYARTPCDKLPAKKLLNVWEDAFKDSWSVVLRCDANVPEYAASRAASSAELVLKSVRADGETKIKLEEVPFSNLVIVVGTQGCLVLSPADSQTTLCTGIDGLALACGSRRSLPARCYSAVAVALPASASFVSQSSTYALVHSTASLPAGAATPLMSIPCRLRPLAHDNRPRPFCASLPPCVGHYIPPWSTCLVGQLRRRRIAALHPRNGRMRMYRSGYESPRTWRLARPRCRPSPPPHPNLARKDGD
ncbi:hypothetical protein DFH09DRAFT_1428214 [Mycena vulgaris]|nr:hypothetical protein DFH09DRAFT_1428214 [Mycena vulgaris]